MALPNGWFFRESTDGQISCFKPETGQECRNPEEISSAPKADGLNELRRNVPAIGPPIPRTTTKKDTDTPIGSTEPTSFAGIRCHFFNGRPRSCHQGDRCAFSHKSVISVTRRRKEQRFRAAQAAQRKPDGPAGLPDLESPTRHSDASKPNAQRTTGGFSNLTWKNSCSSASGTEHAAGATKKRTRSTSPEKQISPSAPQDRPPIGSSAASRSSVPTDTDRAEGPMSATRPTFSCSLQKC